MSRYSKLFTYINILAVVLVLCISKRVEFFKEGKRGTDISYKEKLRLVYFFVFILLSMAGIQMVRRHWRQL